MVLCLFFDFMNLSFGLNVSDSEIVRSFCIIKCLHFQSSASVECYYQVRFQMFCQAHRVALSSWKHSARNKNNYCLSGHLFVDLLPGI